APWANVSFTTFAYVSPVQTIPSCDQTGTPVIAFDGFFHFRSSIISGSASRISPRMRASVSSRQSRDARLAAFAATRLVAAFLLAAGFFAVFLVAVFFAVFFLAAGFCAVFVDFLAVLTIESTFSD